MTGEFLENSGICEVSSSLGDVDFAKCLVEMQQLRLKNMELTQRLIESEEENKRYKDEIIDNMSNYIMHVKPKNDSVIIIKNISSKIKNNLYSRISKIRSIVKNPDWNILLIPNELDLRESIKQLPKQLITQELLLAAKLS